MRNKRNKGNLYSLAKQAKNRLKNYSAIYIEQHKYGATNNYSEKDQLLYKKVCIMLDSDQIIINPIMELIDKPYYNSLSVEAKQKYVFDLTDKYKEMKQRYNKEKNANLEMASNF